MIGRLTSEDTAYLSSHEEIAVDSQTDEYGRFPGFARAIHVSVRCLHNCLLEDISKKPFFTSIFHDIRHQEKSIKGDVVLTKRKPPDRPWLM